MQRPQLPTGCKLGTSFSKSHNRLLQIAFGLRKVDRARKLQPLGNTLDVGKLRDLQHMHELEFVTALEREIESTEPVDGGTEPHAYDVFVMMPSSLCLPSAFVADKVVKLAVVMPLQRISKNYPRPPMMWCDGKNFWGLDTRSHVRRVSSLSGPARVLDVLSNSEPPPLMKWAMKRKMLADVSGKKAAQRFRRNHPDLVDSMNASQLLAVTTVGSRNFQQGFFAIQGPPGCGKTHTIVGMISVIGEGMIVTAPSNAAVANIALKLFETGRYHLTDIVVFGDNCHESVRFLNPKHRSDQFMKFKRNCLNANDEQSAVRLTSFMQWLHLDEKKEVSRSQLRKLCPYIKTETDEGMWIFKKLVSSSKVIFCTLNRAGSSSLRETVKSSKISFATLLLDEAGQCSESEFYIATTFPGIKRIIVVGDPKQLPATVIEPMCKNAGYGNSWLGQVYKRLPERVHLLDTQYRMHPSILDFPNSQFYNYRIRSGDNVLRRIPQISHPVRFIDTSSGGEEERDKRSWKNEYEAKVIKQLLQEDEDIIEIRRQVTQSRTIVITPYKGQVKVLMATLATVTGLGHIDVATVDSFQGQEGDIVVLSTVRTKLVGFTDDPHRLNVALTRAKRVLRVVGKLDFFLSLTGTKSTLKALAATAVERGQTVRIGSTIPVDVVKSNCVGIPKGAVTNDHVAIPDCVEMNGHVSISGIVEKKDFVAKNGSVETNDHVGVSQQVETKDVCLPGYVENLKRILGVPALMERKDVGLLGHAANEKRDSALPGRVEKVDNGILGQLAKNEVDALSQVTKNDGGCVLS